MNQELAARIVYTSRQGASPLSDEPMRNPELFQATSCKVGICLMNKFIPPPSYPFAVATPTTESPFGIAQLRLMAKPYSGQSLSQMYMGPGWLDPSGLACVVFITPNDLYPRRIRQIPECGFLAWRWNNTPSAPFSLSLAIKGGTPRPQMRWIRASSDPVVQAIRKHGQFFVNIISTDLEA